MLGRRKKARFAPYSAIFLSKNKKVADFCGFAGFLAAAVGLCKVFCKILCLLYCFYLVYVCFFVGGAYVHNFLWV